MKKIALLFLLTIVSFNCSDFDDNIQLTNLEELITKDSELYLIIQSKVEEANDYEGFACIEFNYPIVLFEYNNNFVNIGSHTIDSDDTFLIFLQNLNSANSISISYPITTTLADGSLFTVNNNNELFENLDFCKKEETIEQCYDFTFSTSGKCSWKVDFDENSNNNFYLSSFEILEEGGFNFHHDSNTYNTSWVFLFIESELFVNINIEDTDSIATSWNYNWKVIHIDFSTIELVNSSNNTFKLTKVCSNAEPYVVGQTGPSGGITIYDKGEYSNGWRYIEVSANFLINNTQWGCNTSNVTSANQTIVGSGLFNTKKILKHHYESGFYSNPTACSPTSTGTVASKEAAIYEYNNYTDWFLPSDEECLLIYNNINTIVSLNDFWSATEYSTSNSNYFNTTTASIENTDKNNNSIKTILIRYF